MYRSDLNAKDKGGAIAAVIAIHAALLFGSAAHVGPGRPADPQSVLRVFDIAALKPPPPPPPPPPLSQQAKPKEKEGGSAPKNIKSEATPVVAPKPRIVTPPAPQIAVTETPRQGAAPTQGRSDVRGPGTGAGGVGNRHRQRRRRQRPGRRRDGGVADPPRLLTPVLSGRDFARTCFGHGRAAATSSCAFGSTRAATVSECTVVRCERFQAIDSAVCNLAHERLRFRPALDRSGQAVAGWFGYAQAASRYWTGTGNDRSRMVGI